MASAADHPYAQKDVRHHTKVWTTAEIILPYSLVILPCAGIGARVTL